MVLSVFFAVRCDLLWFIGSSLWFLLVLLFFAGSRALLVITGGSCWFFEVFNDF